MQRLVEALPLKQRSLYGGIGFASYLVKGVTDDYVAMAKVALGLASEVTGLRLRPMSLLIANSNAYEADLIDVGSSEYSRPRPAAA